MAHPKSRWEKGSPETQNRMAALAQKAKEAREAKQGIVSPPAPVAIIDNHAPFTVPNLKSLQTVEINEFTGVSRGFPQQSFGPNFLPELSKTQTWPGDKR